jgi:hypothetical protein
MDLQSAQAVVLQSAFLTRKQSIAKGTTQNYSWTIELICQFMSFYTSVKMIQEVLKSLMTCREAHCTNSVGPQTAVIDQAILVVGNQWALRAWGAFRI